MKIQLENTGREYMSIAQVGRFGRTLIVAVRLWFSLFIVAMVSTTAHAEQLSELVTAEYYIDALPGLGGGHLIAIDQTEQFNLAYIIKNIQAPDLAKGVHTIAIRFQNQDGDWSVAIHQSFYWPGYNGPIGSNSSLNPLIKGEVFFDDEEMEEGTGVEVALAADGYLDTSLERLQRIASIRGISAGQHTVSIKLLDSSGIWSAPLKQSFYVYNNSLSPENNGDGNIEPDDTYAGNNNHNGWFFPSRINHVSRAIAYYDDNLSDFTEVTLPSEAEVETGSALNTFISPASTVDLTPGVHSFHLSFQDNTGQWSQPIIQSVLINPTHLVSIGQSTNRLVAARYSLDDGDSVNLTANDGAFNDIIETVEQSPAVSQAYHSASVNFLDMSGQWTDPNNNTTAHIENDTDGNNIPDTWELTWFGQIGVDPMGDADGDGISNLEEFQQGKHPLIDENQTALTISGYVKDPQGNGIPHVLVCLDADVNCPIRTDNYGHYTLGLTQVLTANTYSLYTRSTSASGLKAFSPAKTVTLNDTSLERINFTSQDIQLAWTFSANESYSPNDAIELQWQTNVASNAGVIIDLKRSSVSNDQTAPDSSDTNINWYRFPTFVNNEGIASITIPEGLTDASDWRLSLVLEGANEPKLTSVPFIIDSVIEPAVEIDLTSLTQPMAGEFITATANNTDPSQTLMNYHWSAVQLVAGVESSERILLGDTNTLRTEQLGAGNWRISLQGQNEQGAWSAKANKDIYVTAIDGLADLAISQTSIKVFDADNQARFSVDKDQALTVQVTVSNEGTIDLPDTAKVIIKSQTATLATMDVTDLSAGTEFTLNIPVTAPSSVGYQPLTAEIQFTQNIEAAPEQAIVAESNRFNNTASFYVVVGNPPAASNFAIDLTMDEVITSYPGQTPLVFGNAKYDFASRLPVMGSEVTVVLNGETKLGRTTSPAGNFGVRVKAPREIGDHQVQVTVQGGNLLQVAKNITLRVIPWPDPWLWFKNIGTYTPPVIPTPVRDLTVKRISLSGSSIYRTDNNALAVVQQADFTVNAAIHNNRELSVEAGFTVAFYYVDTLENNSDTSTKYYIGEPVVVNQSLTADQTINVASPQMQSFNNLGNKRIYAEIANVINEDITNNNSRSINVDVRTNYPDLRGSKDSGNLVFSNNSPIPNETIRIVANIVNRGPAVLHDSFTVNFYQGSQLTRTFIGSATYSGGLDKWQSVSVDIEWTANELGTQHIYALIDENNHVDEDSETNNTLSGSVFVIADEAKLKISLGLSDYSVTQSNVITLNSTVTNYGTQASEPSVVRFYWGNPSDNQIIDTVNLNSITKKDNAHLSIDWITIIAHGKHNVCAVIESSVNSENISNTACQTLQITDLPVPDLRVYSEHITYQPDVPEIGNQVSVSALIQNVSKYRNAQNVTVQFYVDSDGGLDLLGDAITIDSIAANGTANVTANANFMVNQPAYVLLVRVLPSAIDGDANLKDNEATTAFAVAGFPAKIIDGDFAVAIPTKEDIHVLDGMMDNGTSEDVYEYSVTLQEELPVGYGLFLNFDDQKGEWFVQNTPGGHLAMEHQGNGEYKLVYQMQKPGLRSFRVGIFSLEDGDDASDDRQVGEYSEHQTCLLDSCKDYLFNLNKNNGNPALSRSGSELFKNVDVATGNYHIAMTDMATQSKGPTFAMTRAYNSQSYGTKGADKIKGGWSFTYEAKATFVDDSFNRQLIIGPREDGRIQHFFKGMAHGDDDNTQKWYALNPGNFEQLIEEANGSFTLYTKGNRLYQFSKPTNSETEGNVPGRLVSIKDRLGNALTFNFDGANNLNGATDANGRSIVITRDDKNRVKRVTDFTLRYVEYTYNDSDMLTAVTSMNGGSHSYTYGNSETESLQLKTITDPRGELQVTISYKLNESNESKPAYFSVDNLVDGDGQLTTFGYNNFPLLQYTSVKRPQIKQVVDDNDKQIIHNLVFILDKNRTRVEKRVDAENYKAFVDNKSYRSSQKSYQGFVSRNNMAEQSLVNTVTDKNESNTKIEYSLIGKGNPEFIGLAVGSDAANNTPLSYTALSYKAQGSAADQINLTPVTSVQKPYQTENSATTRYADFTTTGKPKQVIDPRNHTTQLVYAGVGNNEWLIESTDARNNTTQYGYDVYGNVNKITDAKNSVTNKFYDQLGRVKTEDSPLGLTTTYTYDAHNNIKTKNVKAANFEIDYTTQYFYDANDNLSYRIAPLVDGKMHRVDYKYDELNRKTKEFYIVDGESYSKSYSYDALGRLATVTNERNQTSTTYYTARSQVSHKVNPLQENTVTYTYDANGNVATVTDAKERTIATRYDKLNRKVSVVDEIGNEQKWEYNLAGQVATYTDARNQKTHYQYDKNGNLVWLKDARNGVTASIYDANNNLTKVIGPMGSITEYRYDVLDRKTHTIIHQGNETQTWQYDYDANGNVLTETKPTGERIVKNYDPLNRVIQNKEYNESNTLVRDIAYTYDANSNVRSQSNGDSTISYAYDEINRVTSVTDQFSQTIAYGYDKAGNRTELTYPGNKTIEYSFDEADRLKSLTDWLNNTTEYVRNKSGQTTQVNYPNGSKVKYDFDDAGRLTFLENVDANNGVISRHQLTLDGAGNITNAAAELPLEPELPVNFTASFDSSNRIITAGERNFDHDQSGRIVEQTKATDNIPAVTTTYQFDINDQLTSINKDGELISLYGYDLNNNRISQQQFQAVENTETRYVIDQLASLPNVIAETNDSGEVSNYYIYGEGLVSKINAAGDSHYYHYNPTGHTLALSNSSGFVDDKYAYTSYGKTTKEGNTHNPFLFVGKHGVMDDGNGLHFMRARYYKEDIKRFISLDALHGEMLTPQSLNRYAYVLGNPVMGIDPSGNITLKQFGRNFKYNLISLGKHIGNDVKDASVVAGRVGMDVWDVYIYEPAEAIVNECRSNNEGIILKSVNCVGSAASNAAGAGLDVINPTTAIKASLREPIRIIAGGDKQFEKELITFADAVFALWSIRKAGRELLHHSKSANSTVNAVTTIKEKIKVGKSARGLALNRANYDYHVTKYLETLTNLIKASQLAIKIEGF
jgi:RHS repeat-associated protein